VQSFLVVDAFQKIFDRSARLGQNAIFLAVNFLVFERFHERVTEGVVVRISFSAHADGDVMSLQQIGVVAGCVLDAAIGMMHQTGSG